MADSERDTNPWIVAWAVLGFAAVLVHALVTLTPKALVPFEMGLTQFQTGVYVVWVVWMWYTEGHRAFQKQLCPRMIERAMWLGRNPRPLLVVLAPMFAMGMLHATRKRLIVSWAVTIGIIGLVIAVRFVPQPWRGIIDGGVVVGLGWGLARLLFYWIKSLAGSAPGFEPDLPEEAVS